MTEDEKLAKGAAIPRGRREDVMGEEMASEGDPHVSGLGSGGPIQDAAAKPYVTLHGSEPSIARKHGNDAYHREEGRGESLTRANAGAGRKGRHAPGGEGSLPAGEGAVGEETADR